MLVLVSIAHILIKGLLSKDLKYPNEISKFMLKASIISVLPMIWIIVKNTKLPMIQLQIHFPKCFSCEVARQA